MTGTISFHISNRPDIPLMSILKYFSFILCQCPEKGGNYSLPLK